MTSLFAKRPGPLLSGRRFGYGLVAFYAWLIALLLALGVYSAKYLPGGDSLVRMPLRSALAVLAAGGMAFVLAKTLAAPGLWAANLRLAAALAVLLGTVAGLRPWVLTGAPLPGAWAFVLPAVALLLWTAVDAQRHARLFSAWQRGCDRAMAWLEERVGLGRLAAAIGVLWTFQLLAAALNRYYRLVALADTSIFTQVLYHALHGRPGYESIDGINHLGVHFTPTLGLYLPVFALAPGSFTLLVLQSLAVGAAAIPLWFLALKITGSRRAAFLFALLYLFHPHVQGFNINGVREAGPWPLLGFTYLLAVEQGNFWRRPWFWGLLPLVLGIKEDIPVTIAAISAGFFIMGRDRAAHLAIIGAATVWFFAITKVMMPWLLGNSGHPDLGTGFLFWYRYQELMPTGERGFAGLLLNALLNPLAALPPVVRPSVLEFALTVLVPLLFLPLLSGWHVIALIPGLYLTNALPNDVTMHSTLTQFIAYLVPLFHCALHGWNRAAGWLERSGRPHGGPLPYLALGITLLLLTQHAQPWRPIEPERTAVRRYLEALPRELRVLVPKCLSVPVAARDVVRWVNPEQNFDDVDLVLGESQGTLCRGVNWGFPELERRILASGRFERLPGPIPSVAVYRRKAAP